MRFFKSIKRKAGNAILPVVGTILGLTILAGSVVGVALNSSKIVYRQSNLSKQNDARQILYLAAKYFCEEINPPASKSASTIRGELQDIFGPGLKISVDSTDTDKYYIWYPNKFADSTQTEYDDTKPESQVSEWLKATIVKSDQPDDNGDHGDTGINNTLFSQEAKLDEKFAIGNMMTVYLTDEHLLPGRRYALNEISLVESDIDTFDEAFTYMNNTGVLEIDDIAVALYKYGVLSGGTVSYIETKESATTPYTIVYKTGNLGGNYYWQYNGTSTPTWLYRQEYDIDLLYEMMKYYNKNFSVSKDNLKYSYNDATDAHTIYSKKTSDNFEVTYSSSQRFADAMADYIFWKNLPRLCMYLSDFESKIYELVDAKLKQSYGNYISIWQHTYEWKNEGLTVYPYFRDSRGSWYTEYDYTISEIEDIFVNKLSGYKTSNKLDYQKLYEKLVNKFQTTATNHAYTDAVSEAAYTYFTSDNNNMLKLVNNTRSYSDETSKTSYMYTRFQAFTRNYGDTNNYELGNAAYSTGWFFTQPTYHKFSTWDEGYANGNYDDFDYFYDSDGYYNPNFYDASSYERFSYTTSKGKNTLTQEIIDYITERFKEKYITLKAPMVSSDLQSGQSFDSFAGSGDKLICQPEWNYSNGVFHIYYHFNVIVKVSESTDCYGKVYKYRYEVKNWSSENSGDSFDMTTAEFFETFEEGIADYYSNKILSKKEREKIEQSIDKTTLTRDYLKKLLVNPIRYQYLPTNTLNEVLGNDAKQGMKQLSITNKLVTYYLENGNDPMKTEIGDYDYQIDIVSASYDGSKLGNDYKNFLEYVVEFKVSVDSDKDGKYTDHVYTRKISFILQYMTYSSQNNALYNSSTKTYTDVPNNNVTTGTDSDGSTKNFFSPVVIKNNKSQAISKADLNNGKTNTILSCIPYTERINSTQVPYGDHKITIDGKDYKVATSLSELSNVQENTIYNGTIENLGSDNAKIKVKDGISLFINGDLHLKNDQQLELGKNSLLFVNGNMQIEYRYIQTMRKEGRTYYTRELRTADYDYFYAHGVNVKAGVDAKIMVNGNFDYRGFKAKYATSTSGFTIYNTDGTQENVKLDTIYEQFVFNTNFKDRNGNTATVCALQEDHTWNHYSRECRGLLEGIYIVNGDVTFHAWDEKNVTDNSYSQTVAMYRNMYSNPLINGTFYVDGSFDMRGLYTSSLYDPCRANFVFSKSIVEPLIALNTVLCAGKNTNYEAWADTDGYLFMICEEAIDFSKVNFACVNLFTPFQELVNAINANKQSATNFSEFIEKSVFTAMYPDNKVIDEWGLPSILRAGLNELYAPGDIGAITPEDHRYGNDV